MKHLRILIVLSLIYCFTNQVIYSNTKEVNDNTKEEQALIVTSDASNTFLEIKVKSSLFFQDDSVKNPLKIEVRILNQKGIVVYSGTKNVNVFDIFTGGLPQGKYTLSCKICSQQMQREFAIKR